MREEKEICQCLALEMLWQYYHFFIEQGINDAAISSEEIPDTGILVYTDEHAAIVIRFVALEVARGSFELERAAGYLRDAATENDCSSAIATEKCQRRSKPSYSK